ncbi:M23 family metallopeptidase [Pseudoalteromonas sp. MMG022]|uniref:M23 family metallopeptidase n=1 Tax=Pseudoalteromonas sp. MMG022 TaxID=2909978 RepID=UPI001F3AA84C|nr:M23 family metallopeptidase [Pseudoalteromonas sp. MMG022]MCF6436699.1 M23 family metallopeptidase [Pseudoalteromonas sp. MMG022]
MKTSIYIAFMIAILSACSEGAVSQPGKVQDVSTPTDVKQAASKSQSVEADSKQQDNPLQTTIITIEQGQSLIGVLKPFGFSANDAWRVRKLAKSTLDVDRIRVGDKVKVEHSGENLRSLTLATTFTERLRIERTPKGWTKRGYQLQVNSKPVIRSFEVSNSIFDSAQTNDVPLDIINQMIFAYSHFIDFQREIHKGDKVRLLFDEQVILSPDALQAQHSKPTQLRYARLFNNEEPIEIFHFEDEEVLDGFYFKNGRPARGFLLKTPLNGARLSSEFGHRKHPILGYTRLHAGLDFGAPHGTPIFAAGNGKIEKAGWGGGFGNRILIEHGQGYHTLYAHLDRFVVGLKPGDKVTQGQVIGYLGNTGLSQARHLHYEVHKNGKPINPLSLKNVVQTPLQGALYAKFQDLVIDVEDTLQTTRLAMRSNTR